MSYRVTEISLFLYESLPAAQKEKYKLLRNVVMDCIKQAENNEKSFRLYKKKMESSEEYPVRELYQDRPINEIYRLQQEFESRDTRYQELLKQFQETNKELYQAKLEFGVYKKALKTIFDPELKLDETN